jgi:malic enzyme
MKTWFAENTNPDNFKGSISDALKGADLFLGLSGPGAVKGEDVRAMGKDAIVFAMANPTPEVMPEEVQGYVRIMATGRSDYPNQINNVLAFPGVFRGAVYHFRRLIPDTINPYIDVVHHVIVAVHRKTDIAHVVLKCADDVVVSPDVIEKSVVFDLI